jgi:phosphoribosyl-dephospho-CoA transferase
MILYGWSISYHRVFLLIMSLFIEVKVIIVKEILEPHNYRRERKNCLLYRRYMALASIAVLFGLLKKSETTAGLQTTSVRNF